MLATEEAARRLDETAQTNIKKTQTILDQGMGFLSPQTCPSNPNYNSMQNQFRAPSFRSSILYDPPRRENYSNDDDWGRAMLSYENDYQARVALERTGWEATNTCPGGLVNTTPGSVVGNSIMTALSGGQRLTELGAAMGNSLSAIFVLVISI